ncbi:hypothetical protein [Kribbella qitaiheensis]|uniref:hypothetical protein n=1 Tax=Kribbella qitaiheensis TaxID=1544730 RepID=UPI0019D5DB93|nr:hypothetical protein [Kribbella qitaiheensis]
MSTPPMGWNSWDCYGSTVTEEEVLANARFMAERLLPYGWDTVVIDILWYEAAARAHGYNDDPELVLDDHGQLLPALNRFPSAAGGKGFAPLAAEVHGLGLRFGVHMMRGYAAVFWLGDEPHRAAVPLRSIGATPSDVLTDLWTGETLPATEPDLSLELDPHGSLLLRLDPATVS